MRVTIILSHIHVDVTVVMAVKDVIAHVWVTVSMHVKGAVRIAMVPVKA